MSFDTQVPRAHYFQDYDTKNRWASYWYQINEILNTRGKTVLEVGIGNGTVADYLRRSGLEVTTVDIDSALNPDYVCSVTELTKVFQPDSFDTILCAEVLEHIPFEYFEKSLEELQKVAKNFVILSLPHFGIKLRFSVKIPLVRQKNILIKIPYPRKYKFDGQHYWEIGKKGYPLSKIIDVISKHFNVERNYLVPENPYHMFFILRAKK